MNSIRSDAKTGARQQVLQQKNNCTGKKCTGRALSYFMHKDEERIEFNFFWIYCTRS